MLRWFQRENFGRVRTPPIMKQSRLARFSLLVLILCWSGKVHAFDTVVVFNELHYHPTEGNDLEYIELYNQHSVDIDLSGWRLSGGIDFDLPARTILKGGDYLVIAANPAALRAVTGPLRILGPFEGSLENKGERIRLRNNNDRIMDEVEYNDREPWPVGADGSGASLAKISADTKGELGTEWAASRDLGGTPGTANVVEAAVPLVINEVAGSAAQPGRYFIELLSLDGPIEVGGYVIATESGQEFVIPEGQVALEGIPFDFSEAELGFRVDNNDNIYLYQASRATLVDAIRGDDSGRARYPDGEGPFYFTGGEIAATPGEDNAAPLGSAIVINEIMYHHRPTYPNVGVEYATNPEEWVELHNSSDVPVPVGGWELDGAVRFTIPAGTTIPEGGYLVLARDAAAFAVKFPEVPVVGDWSGSLSNRHEELILRNVEGNPTDRVHYYDDQPWPAAADGDGSSMELRNPFLDNASPDAWRASSNADTSEWHDYEFTMRATTPTYTPAIFNFHELRLGLLDSGEILLDDVSVIEAPNGANRELIANGEFNGSSGWLFIGTHQNSRPVAEGRERVLRLLAEGRMNYLNNLIEGRLTLNGSSPRSVQNGTDYKVSFRAKWLSGSPQLRFELYYNKLAKTVILRQPERCGTPGRQNSTYEENTGPVYTDLRHEPVVPESTESVEVSVRAQDPDGIASMILRYSVRGGSFRLVPMTLDEDDQRWKGTIPRQSNGSVVQFYVEGKDESSTSFAPALGSRSRALYKVERATAHGVKHSIRIVMTSGDSSRLHTSTDILSNRRFGCTLITDEKVAAYDSGIRLRGSMFSRQNSSSTALNLKFPSNQRYRGVHSTITTRRGNMREILVKHIINSAGGLHDNFNDVLHQYGHIGGQNGRVRTEMARFGSPYLRGLPNGTEGTVFKMEGIREFRQTQNGTPSTPKLPHPIGWIRSFDLANQGADKEIYRHNMRINGNFAKDDYTEIMAMCRSFSLTGTTLEREVAKTIDVDHWCRQFALMSLCGIGDTYSQGNPHNLSFYVRPSDGRVESIPWDWDFTFNRSANSGPWGDRNVAKIFSRPVYSRLFYGHLNDLINTTFSTRYLSSWFSHYGRCTQESYTGNLNYISARATHIRNILPRRVVFRVTTNAGRPITTNQPTVTIDGVGWIDVREVQIEGTPDAVPLTWVDGSRWRLTIPVPPGESNLVLKALNHQGASVGSAAITVVSSGAIVPAAPGNLVISEVHYNPLAGAEEFLELTNITDDTLDLTGLVFSAGIDFEFPTGTKIGPRERWVIVQDEAAFRARYGEGPRILGVFANDTRLSNGGEKVRLETVTGENISEFSYNNSTPWPEAADGVGFSLVLVAPESAPDPKVPANWRSSVNEGGTPGSTDATVFSGDPEADDNGDGLSNLMNYGLGTGGLMPDVSLTGGGRVRICYTRNLAADDLIWTIEGSDDLENWEELSGFSLDDEKRTIPGLAKVVMRSNEPSAPEDRQRYVRVRVRLRE